MALSDTEKMLLLFMREADLLSYGMAVYDDDGKP
jgi:hypothetical protein